MVFISAVLSEVVGISEAKHEPFAVFALAFVGQVVTAGRAVPA